MMEFKTLLAAGLLSAVVSCKKDNDTKGIAPRNVEACGVTNPLENLPWLKEIIEEHKAAGQGDMLNVTMFRSGEKTIFNVQLAYMACLGCVSYYCDGTPVDFSGFSEKEREAYYADLTGKGKVVLWPWK